VDEEVINNEKNKVSLEKSVGNNIIIKMNEILS
jgi:hypothetical protein